MSDTPTTGAPPASPLKLLPFGNPTFRSLWLATQVSNLGWLMQVVAISWLMATISSSDVMVPLVQASSALPGFILSICAGAIVDNFNRRTIMLVSRCVIAAAFGLLSVLLALGAIDPWTILALSFFAGCGVAFNDPAWQASVGDIVDRRELPAAVMLITVGFNTVRSIGPALGGIVVAVFGPLAAVLLASLGNIAPLWVMARRKWSVHSLPLPRESMTTAIQDGVRFTALSSDIKAAIARGMLLGLCGIGLLALLPLFVRDELRQGPVAYGILMAGFGTGALCAGICNGSLRRIMSQDRLITAAFVACSASAAALALSPPLFMAAIALALGGAGWVTAWSGLGVSVQMTSPRWVVGRTLSIHFAFAHGGIAAGSLLWGTIAQNYSIVVAFGGSAGALLLVAMAGLFMPIRGAEETNLDSHAGFDAPVLAQELMPRSGPIVVRIGYLIAQEDLSAFLAHMRQRRHALSRSGARLWSLQRDLQNPSHWIEMYRTPTWTDFLRLNHRLTTADQKLHEDLIRLHAGETSPQPILSIERPTASLRRTGQLRFFGLLHGQ